MRLGKTQQQIEVIKDCLSRNETVFIGGMKDPTNYLERLGGGYIAEPHYAKRSFPIEIMYSDFYRIDTREYLPTLMGYTFKKI